MDQNNKISLEDVVEEQKAQAVTAGRIVHITAAIILLVAATLAFAFTAYFEVTYFVEPTPCFLRELGSVSWAW